MSDHIERMITEKDDLSVKIRKLENFLESDTYIGLNKFQKYLMSEQLEAMKKYLDILTARIQSDRFVALSKDREIDAIDPSEHS